jgi:archaemetzincin
MINRAEPLCILIVPSGPVDTGIVSMLKRELPQVFYADLRIAGNVPVPADALDPARGQYGAEAVAHAVARLPGTGERDRLLAVIDRDLFTPGLNFVFGIASGHLALVSLARLRQEFYGLPADRPLFHRRVLTEAVHELGHTFWLFHCTDPRCVMFFSNTLADTDRKGPAFCTRCMKLLKEQMQQR